MTEEELEKEAGEYAKPFYNMTRYDYVEERTHIKEAYLAGAEPREKRIIELKDENNKLLDVINNQDVKIADLEKENKNLEGCLFAEQEHTLMSEKQIEKMKCCQNCKWQYCECSSAFIDKDTGKETKHCWNEEKEKYCDVGFEGKYQCWELRE